MSTEPSSRGERARARRRRFTVAFAIVVAVLVGGGLTGAAVALAQGPRVTRVDVDPAAAATTSGARLILTLTERMAPVEQSQVEITPAVPFTVDTSGRSVGIRFGLPLDDDTDYAVRISGASGADGGTPATLTAGFRTPAAEVYLLRRAPDGDTIFRTALQGTAAVPVFRAPDIEDFRATPGHLAIVVRGDGDLSRLVVTDPDGANPRDLRLPGEGFVTNLQSADRGERVGYTFTDSQLSATGHDSALYTASLRDADADADPARIAPAGYDVRVADWRFVPDSDRVLLVSFDGSLVLAGGVGGDATLLGTAAGIDGIARGSLVAVIQRVGGRSTVDLTTGVEAPLVDAVGVPGSTTRVLPVPGTDGETFRSSGLIGDGAVSLGTAVVRVAADGSATTLYDAPGSAAVLQLCASPSGRYLAVLVAPDIVSNAYDGYRLPMPETVETRIVDARTGAEVSGLAGFDVSWCAVPPP